MPPGMLLVAAALVPWGVSFSPNAPSIDEGRAGRVAGAVLPAVMMIADLSLCLLFCSLFVTEVRRFASIDM